MLSVRDNDLAVGKLHFVARPSRHDLSGGHDSGRLTVGPHDLITDSHVPHRRPARRSWQRRVKGQGFAHSGPGRDDDHLARVQAVGEGVQVGEAGGTPVIAPPRLPIASISSRAPGMMSAREW